MHLGLKLSKEEEYEKIAEFIRNNQGSCYRVAYSYMRDREKALDVVQEAACKALAKFHFLRAQDSLKPWFYKILVNTALDQLRREKHEVVSDEILDNLVAPIQTDRGELADLYGAVQRLPENQRRLIFLRYFEDLTLEEMAQVTQTNLNTVKTRLYSGLSRLKDEMRSEESAWKRISN